MFIGHAYWKPCMVVSKTRNNDTNSSSSDSNNTTTLSNYKIGAFDYFLWFLLFLGILIISCSVFSMLHPHDPALEFQVDSLDVTSVKIYNNSNDYYSIVGDQKYIAADLELTVTLKNKDEVLMYFDNMQVSLLDYHHNNDSLSSTMLKPFHLLEDQLQLQFGMQIKDNEIFDSISRDLWGQNVLQFDLKAQGHSVSWRGALQNCSINVFCDDIQVRFLRANNLTTGSMTTTPVLCKCKTDCHQP